MPKKETAPKAEVNLDLFEGFGTDSGTLTKHTTLKGQAQVMEGKEQARSSLPSKKKSATVNESENAIPPGLLDSLKAKA